MVRKAIQDLIEQKDFFSATSVASYFGLYTKEKINIIREILKELSEKKVAFQDENGFVFPLVATRKAKNTIYYSISTKKEALNLFRRILLDKGVNITPDRPFLTIESIKEKLGDKVTYLRIRRQLEKWHRFEEQFLSSNGEVKDLVMSYRNQGGYVLYDDENALNMLKKELEKTIESPILMPSLVAVRSGLQKGFGVLIEHYMKKIQPLNLKFVNKEGEEKPLVHRYIIGGKERFFLANDPAALEMFQKIYFQAREKEDLPPALEKMKKKNYAVFCSELQRAYDEGAMYLHENGKQYPLVEKKYSLNKEYRLVISQNSIAFQLFKKRLIQRIKENEEMNEGFGTTNLAKMLKMPMTTTSWVREVLKTLHDNQTTYVDETGKEHLLVMKKKTKYILMGGKIGFKEFKTHFDQVVSRYAKKPKNYLSYFQIMAQLGVETTHKKLNESLNEMYSERLLVAHPNGCVSPAVQRFRIKHYVLPFLSSAPAALTVLKNRLMQNEK